jgi:anti-anti-sigma factor
MSDGPARFHIEHTIDGETATLALGGELDMMTSQEMQLQVDALFEQGIRNLVFDCSAVSFMDSSALRVIVGAEIRAHDDDGGTVTVQEPSETVGAIMEVAGITDMITRP